MIYEDEKILLSIFHEIARGSSFIHVTDLIKVIDEFLERRPPRGN